MPRLLVVFIFSLRTFTFTSIDMLVFGMTRRRGLHSSFGFPLSPQPRVRAVNFAFDESVPVSSVRRHHHGQLSSIGAASFSDADTLVLFSQLPLRATPFDAAISFLRLSLLFGHFLKVAVADSLSFHLQALGYYLLILRYLSEVEHTI